MVNKYPVILAIESSCDETAAAVVDNGNIVSNIVASQPIHTQYGGIVPELASRTHQQHIIPVITQAIDQAKRNLGELDAIAFTQGPGLLGALLVGASVAKSMAFGLNIPLIAVHHMRGHILANFIEDPYPNFPFLCLTVSGGHTQLVLVKSPLDMELIGTTQDDAVGEAFDKIGKLMGLPYPAGPLIDQYAKKGDASRFTFPTTNMPKLDFSFSGIKTAFLYFIRQEQQKDPNFITQHRDDLCASIQTTLVQMLLAKLRKAAEQTGIKTIALAGGVAANSELRRQLQEVASQNRWMIFIPQPAYCTDNAAMVAMAAHYQYMAQDFSDLTVPTQPRMPL